MLQWKIVGGLQVSLENLACAFVLIIMLYVKTSVVNYIKKEEISVSTI